MDKAASLTMALAAIGAALGVLNTWHAYYRDRVRIRVIPGSYRVGGTDCYGIEVINLSLFPVTIRQVGFTLPERKEWLPFDPIHTIGCVFPQRMEGLTSFTAYMPIFYYEAYLGKIERAYAFASHGKWYTGITRSFRRELRAAARRKPGDQ